MALNETLVGMAAEGITDAEQLRNVALQRMPLYHVLGCVSALCKSMPRNFSPRYPLLAGAVYLRSTVSLIRARVPRGCILGKPR